MLVRALAIATILALPMIGQAQIAGMPSHPRLGVWTELKIQINQNDGYEDAVQDSDKTNAGAGVEIGWQPLLKSINSTDSRVERALKSIGLSFGYNGNVRPGGFNDYLYSYEVCDSYPRYYEDQYGNLVYDDGCTLNSVYARDAYVKYERSSITIGAYVPFEVAQRLQVAGGVNVRFHELNETYRSDESNITWRTSINAVLKVTYLVTENFGVVGSYQHSVSGLKNRSFTVGVTYRW